MKTGRLNIISGVMAREFWSIAPAKSSGVSYVDKATRTGEDDQVQGRCGRGQRLRIRPPAVEFEILSIP
jgi:hypothetical protein